ncbi:hypothetical protein JCM10450v2_006614 [Rhodotorula kratochvilovae]
MADAMKKKKPPACDYCKAKRVLCHPSPQGCPRCLEKGIQCATTPVVRRKPQRKPKVYPDGAGGSHESSVEPGSAPTSALPVPPPSDTLPLQTVDAASSVSVEPSALSSIPVDFPSFPTTVPPSALVASTSQIPYAPTALALTTPKPAHDLANPSPALARHLFDCFRNTSQYDHPIFRGTALQEVFEPVAFHLELLEPQIRIFAYCALTFGALISFDEAIIGSGGPLPAGFKHMEALSAEMPDLRDFGRRRWAAFSTMRDHAVRVAKEADVLLQASKDNAGTCLMLDLLTNVGDDAPPNRPYLAAYMNHIRTMVDTGEFDDDNAQVVWSIHLSSDMFSEVAAGRLTSTETDQLILAGSVEADLDGLEEKIRSWLPRPHVNQVWGQVLHPFSLAYLSLGRELIDKILSAPARRQPYDEAVMAHFLKRLHRFRSVTSLLLQLLDSLLEGDEPWMFPHAKPRRVRYTPQMALRGIRGFIAISGSVLVVPLYRELCRRLSEAEDAARTATDDRAREEAQERFERVELTVRQVRRILPDAFGVVIDALDRSPHIILFAAMRRIGIVDWAAVVLHEVETGAIPLNDKLVGMLEKLAVVFKRAGYAYTSPHIDALIARLEAHAFAYRLANAVPAAPPAPALADAAAAAAHDFQFAFLSELSGSAENSPADSAGAAGAAGAGTASVPVHTQSMALNEPAFDLGAFTASAEGAAEAPAFSAEELAQLLGTGTADATGGFGADVLAGWGSW